MAMDLDDGVVDIEQRVPAIPDRFGIGVAGGAIR
jgi:hypothetical protein